jgi:hypothetical protein
MRILLLFTFLILCSAGFASAQMHLSQATKFDEFGDVYPTDAAARLDNFAIALQQQPTAKGFIIGYRSFRDLPGLSGRRVNWMRSYLVHSRGLQPEQIKAVDGGEASCLAHEFWIVPVGTAPTPRADAYSRGFDDSEVARKFDEFHYTIPQDQLDSFSSEYEDGLEGFADALRKAPKSIAYVIGYAGYELLPKADQNRQESKARIDPPGTVAKGLAGMRTELIKLGIPANRIKSVHGGYRKWRAMEFWILPRGALAPTSTPNVAPKPRR